MVSINRQIICPRDNKIQQQFHLFKHSKCVSMPFSSLGIVNKNKKLRLRQSPSRLTSCLMQVIHPSYGRLFPSIWRQTMSSLFYWSNFSLETLIYLLIFDNIKRIKIRMVSSVDSGICNQILLIQLNYIFFSIYIFIDIFFCWYRKNTIRFDCKYNNW